MKRNRFFVLGMAALLLTFILLPAQHVSAQRINSPSVRNDRIMTALRANPYFIVIEVAKSPDLLNGILKNVPEVEGAHYHQQDGGLYIVVNPDSGPAKMLVLEFFKDKASAEEKIKKNVGWDNPVVGPFGKVNTLERILRAIAAFKANPDKLPEQW